MDQLLEQVLTAHGGVDEWRRVRALTVRMTLAGPFWAARGWSDAYDNTTARIDTRHPHIIFTPSNAEGIRSEFTVSPETIRVLDQTGALLEQREDPRASFPPFELTVAWDAVQTAYFTSCAVWPYLTEPFLFTWPDVEAHEIDPWTEGDETWRRLAVTFPSSLPNHNDDQVFYYDSNFHQRRMDYRPDVTAALIAHYSDHSREFDGFLFPTRRRIHLRMPDGTAHTDLTPITIDVHDVRVDRD